MEKDLVCGMSVEPLRAAAQEEHEGKNYFFCSVGCATKFRSNPVKFLSQPKITENMLMGTVAPAGPQDVVRGASPSLPMAESWRHDAPAGARKNETQAAEYICPMDPEVREDHAGAGPKC